MEIIYLAVSSFHVISISVMIFGLFCYCLGAANSHSPIGGFITLFGLLAMVMSVLWLMRGNFFIPLVRFV